MNQSAIETLSNSFKILAQGNSFSDFITFLTRFMLLLLLGFILYFLIHIGNNHIDRTKRVKLGKKEIIYFFSLTFIVFVLIFLFSLRGLLKDIFSPFIFAIILAYILNPFVRYFHTKGLHRLWGVIIVYMTISVAVSLLSITLIPRIIGEVKKLIEFMPTYGNESFEYLYGLYLKYNRNVDSLPTELDGVKDLLRLNIDRIQQVVFGVVSSITNTLLHMFSRIIGLVLIPILAFYFLKDADQFKKSLILFLPKKYRSIIINVAKDIDEVLGGFIRGQLTVAAFVGILTTLVLLVLRVEFAVLVGMIAGFANVIPYFGPIIGIVPGVIFALIDSPAKALWVVIAFTVIQQIESAILSPKIVGKSVGIHPIFVILALIIGGRLFGIIGLLIAIPMAGIIKVLGKHLIQYIANF